jgi:hypothetical protein
VWLVSHLMAAIGGIAVFVLVVNYLNWRDWNK